MLVDLAIQVLNRSFLKVIFVTVLWNLYIFYFNIETFISNNLNKMRNRLRIWEIRIDIDFLV